MLITVPLRTGRGLNDREHHMARHRRVKKEKEAVAWFLIGKATPTGQVRVVMRRVSPSSKGLDGDNLQGSQKGVRDQVAAWLGRDDGDPSVEWIYAQRPGKKGEWAVEIEITGEVA